MKSLCLAALLLLLFLDVSHAIGSHRQRRRERQEGERRGEGGRMFSDLTPQEPRVELETDGGKMEVWGGRGSGVFEDANVAACRTTLKRRGIWLPSYVDSPTLHLVTEGCGRVGIISPFAERYSQENTFKVEKGDVVAAPKGNVIWWYNDGERDLEIVGAADVSESPRPASVRAFHLAGGGQESRQEREERERETREERREREKEPRRREEDEERREQQGYRAVIHGFSREALAQAWQMDESRVEEILKGQSEVGIVRVDEDISFPEDSSEEHRRRSSGSNLFPRNFIYRFGKVHPDVRVRNGGELRELNSYRLPILKYLGLSMECMQLEQGAMVSPNYFQNGHQVLYVIEGRGKIEAVHNNGEKALDEEVSKGSLVVIPAFFPSTKIASCGEEFHYISFVTTDRPVMSYLSGRKSVYQGIPLRVLSKVLNVDEEKAKQIQRAHERESVIFPAEKESRRTKREEGEEEEETRRRREEKEAEEKRRRREEEEESKGRKRRDADLRDMAWSLAL